MCSSAGVKILARLEEPSYAALRIVAGLMFACHGLQKIFGWLTERPTPAIGSQLWIGGAIELVGGALIALGLGTRIAAFLSSGTMAVAYFQYHQKGDLSDWHWLPLMNRGELAALYCFVFLFIAARGPGRWSFDGRGR